MTSGGATRRLTSDDDSFSRRTGLRTTAALGGLTLGSSGLAAARDGSGHGTAESTVDDVQQFPRQQARQYLQAGHDPEQTRALRERLTAKDLRPTPNDPLAFDVSTDHPEMAGRDPVLVLLPFVERENPNTATKAGFLTLRSVDTDEGRGAAAGFAFSAAADDAVGASTADTDPVGRWTLHGRRDGRTVELASAPVSPADGASTQVNLGCTQCTVIVGGLRAAGGARGRRPPPRTPAIANADSSPSSGIHS